MKINNNYIQTNGYFAFDGDHKIYILEDSQDMYEAAQLDYDILHIDLLKETYDNACPLKFINNWKLTKTYAEQCENAIIEGE